MGRRKTCQRLQMVRGRLAILRKNTKTRRSTITSPTRTPTLRPSRSVRSSRTRNPSATLTSRKTKRISLQGLAQVAKSKSSRSSAVTTSRMVNKSKVGHASPQGRAKVKSGLVLCVRRVNSFQTQWSTSRRAAPTRMGTTLSALAVTVQHTNRLAR